MQCKRLVLTYHLLRLSGYLPENSWMAMSTALGIWKSGISRDVRREGKIPRADECGELII